MSVSVSVSIKAGSAEVEVARVTVVNYLFFFWKFKKSSRSPSASCIVSAIADVASLVGGVLNSYFFMSHLCELVWMGLHPPLNWRLELILLKTINTKVVVG